MGSGLLAAAEAAEIDKLPVIEIRSPILYSLLPPQQVLITPHQVDNFNLLKAFSCALREGACPAIRIDLLASMQGQGQVNLRASFLAGKVVVGDALLSKIRLRPNE